MKRTASLDGPTRDFFTLVNRAVFANPFSQEREKLDLSIAGIESAPSDEIRLQAVIQAVDAQLMRLDGEKPVTLDDYTSSDAGLIRNVLLFTFFHRFIGPMDNFIRHQAEAGDDPLQVPFAKDAMQWLRQRRFSKEESLRSFELVYQLRRAFYFINTSLVGCSRCMRDLRRKLWNNVFTQNLELYSSYLWDRMEDFSTLLLGETGTGKGTAAAAIGRSGFIPFDERRGRFKESFTHSFVSINLSQFPENLLESELFGHKKGAFTGAVEEYKGLLDRCSPHGATFLDEIGEVSEPIQVKLLEVLQERVFSPVGSHVKHRFQGRIIGATNQPVDELRQKGRMREDFYYRLCSDVITVPSLQLRIREDSRELENLVALLVKRLLGQASPAVQTMVLEVVDQSLGPDYPWPGNVRELAQCVRRVILNRSYEGSASPVARNLEQCMVEGVRNGTLKAGELLAGYCALLYKRHGTYEAVARITGLDRRTVKKNVLAAPPH